MRRRMTLAEAHEYAQKWSVAPVRRESMAVVYELPFHFIRFGDFGTDYRLREGSYRPLVGQAGDYRLDLVTGLHTRKLDCGPVVLRKVWCEYERGRAQNKIVLTGSTQGGSLELHELEHFQLVLEGMRVLAGLDRPEIYLDFLLDSLQGDALAWLETAIQR